MFWRFHTEWSAVCWNLVSPPIPPPTDLKISDRVYAIFRINNFLENKALWEQKQTKYSNYEEIFFSCAERLRCIPLSGEQGAKVCELMWQGRVTFSEFVYGRTWSQPWAENRAKADMVQRRLHINKRWKSKLRWYASRRVIFYWFWLTYFFTLVTLQGTCYLPRPFPSIKLPPNQAVAVITVTAHPYSCRHMS